MGVTQEICDKLQYQKDEKAKNPHMRTVEDPDDGDSIASESCWEEMYRGDSRKWLLRDESIKLKTKPIASTMKSSYMYPQYEQLQLKGRRQLLLEAKLLKEVLEEMKEEHREKEVILDYLTTYDDLHRTPGFRPNDKKDYEKNKELYEKYPLYTSLPISFWQFQCDKSSSNLISVPGMTMTKDMKNPFKKNSHFTTPVTQSLYCDEL